jgi:hypothetical protein
LATETPEATLTPTEILEQTFLAAKQKDEFEYVCALLRIRGMEDAGWDRLEETATLVREMLSLAEAPLLVHTRARLGLLTYCHVVEADAIYEVLDNMLRTIEGERCSIDPFADLYRKKKPSKGRPFGVSIPPSAKEVIKSLCEHARRVGDDELAALIDGMFHDGVRNAFFHSDYILYKDEFRSREAALGTQGRHSLTLQELGDIINRGLGFYEAFMQVWRDHKCSYKESKIVEGRFRADGGLMPLRLLVHPTHGVYGFTSNLAEEA